MVARNNTMDRLDYYTQALFERRKTQYQWLFFFLTLVGASTLTVLNSDIAKQPTRVLILLVPIFFAIPTYIMNWYQRYRISALNEQIVSELKDPSSKSANDEESLENWQAKAGTWATELAILFAFLAPIFAALFLHCTVQEVKNTNSALSVYILTGVVGVFGIVYYAIHWRKWRKRFFPKNFK